MSKRYSDPRAARLSQYGTVTVIATAVTAVFWLASMFGSTGSLTGPQATLGGVVLLFGLLGAAILAWASWLDRPAAGFAVGTYADEDPADGFVFGVYADGEPAVQVTPVVPVPRPAPVHQFGKAVEVAAPVPAPVVIDSEVIAVVTDRAPEPTHVA